MELILDLGDFAVPEGLEPRYRAIMAATFRRLGVKVDYEVDCSFVDDDTIHELNRQYRGIDRPTDVLSWAFNEGGDPVSSLEMGEGEHPLLGEIIIDFDQALRQAKAIGNTPMRELSFLFTHGLLHILGYDHMEEEERKVMFALQDEILKEVEANG